MITLSRNTRWLNVKCNPSGSCRFIQGWNQLNDNIIRFYTAPHISENEQHIFSKLIPNCISHLTSPIYSQPFPWDCLRGSSGVSLLGLLGCQQLLISPRNLSLASFDTLDFDFDPRKLKLLAIWPTKIKVARSNLTHEGWSCLQFDFWSIFWAPGKWSNKIF